MPTLHSRHLELRLSRHPQARTPISHFAADFSSLLSFLNVISLHICHHGWEFVSPLFIIMIGYFMPPLLTPWCQVDVEFLNVK
jgi:hypothetical protein